MKHITLNFAVATIAICLMTPAAHAQRSDLDLRFHAPFPFSVGTTRSQQATMWSTGRGT